MAAFYPYIISSLPALQFGARAPFSFERFIEMCRDMVPETDLAYIRECADDASLLCETGDVTLAQWRAYEIGLRNELVKIRAGRKKTDAHKYLRPGADGDQQLFHVAMNSHRIPSIIESERFLDRHRWSKLDDLLFGHYFDRAALIVYALKLRILLRWDAVDRVDKQAILERILA